MPKSLFGISAVKDMSNNNKKIYNYTVILEKEEEGGYHAFCPMLKGCHSQGDTFEETIENIYRSN